MIEIGKRYLFMTVTFYWCGTVVSVTPSHATIERVRLVKDIGDQPTFKEPFPEQNEIKQSVSVALAGTTFVGIQ